MNIKLALALILAVTPLVKAEAPAQTSSKKKEAAIVCLAGGSLAIAAIFFTLGRIRARNLAKQEARSRGSYDFNAQNRQQNRSGGSFYAPLLGDLNPLKTESSGAFDADEVAGTRMGFQQPTASQLAYEAQGAVHASALRAAARPQNQSTPLGDGFLLSLRKPQDFQ